MEYLLISIFVLTILAIIARVKTKRGIESNLDNFETAINMESSQEGFIFQLDDKELQEFPLKTHQILFVESGCNPKINNFLSTNINQLKTQFSDVIRNNKPTELILLDHDNINESELSFNEVVKYNAPYLEDTDLDYLKNLYSSLQTKELVALFDKKYGVKLDKPGLIRIDLRTKNFHYKCFESDEPSYLTEFFTGYINNIKDDQGSRRAEFSKYHFDDIKESRKTEKEKSRENYDTESANILFDLIHTADEELSFNTSNNKLLYEDSNFDELSIREEIQEKISILVASGRSQVAISIALNILDRTKGRTTTKLSKLRITKDFKIVLVDFNNTEIHLTPLQKTLYFLFLKYPNGINLKHLVDYRQQLIDIYLILSNRESIDSVIESIDNLINPINNSVNEKASRIKEAFISEFVEDIAKNYYLTGGRGKPKKVDLPPELIIWEPTDLAL